MDITMDNNKPSEIDNVTMNQALLSNANTDLKHEMDETNNIFGVTGDHLHHVNDKLNNIIDLNNPMNVIENKEHAILSAVLEKTCLENDGDMGPETSVDTTDDADIDTDPLECSTLSHSKETLPSSDYPLDNKFVPHSLEMDELNLQEKAPSLTSPNTDMPFDTHGHEMHEDQHINFEDMSHNGVGDQNNPFAEKIEGLHVGEDDFKTDGSTYEIRETTMTCFEYSAGGVTDIDQLGNATSEVIEQMQASNVGWDMPEGAPTKGDLAYNQFEEYIEQPVEKKINEELNQENFEASKEELVECPTNKSNFDYINGGISTVLDTPSSISAGSDNNFDSFVPHQETNDQVEHHNEFADEPRETPELSESGNQDFDAQDQERQNELFDHADEKEGFGSHDNDLDDFSEQEKHLNESPEYEKHSDFLGEHDKHLEEFEEHTEQGRHLDEEHVEHERHLGEEHVEQERHLDEEHAQQGSHLDDKHAEQDRHLDGFGEHESLKEELQTMEKHFQDELFHEKFNEPVEHLETLNNQEEPIDEIPFEAKRTEELNGPQKEVTELDEKDQEKLASESNELDKPTSDIQQEMLEFDETHIGKPTDFDEHLNAFNEQEKFVDEANEFEKHHEKVPEHEKEEDFNSMIIKDDIAETVPQFGSNNLDDVVEEKAEHENELESHVETINNETFPDHTKQEDHVYEEMLENTQNLAENVPQFEGNHLDDVVEEKMDVEQIEKVEPVSLQQQPVEDNIVADEFEEKTEVVEQVEKVEAVSLQQLPVEDLKEDLHEELIENQTNEMAIESKTPHLDKSYDELSQMNEQVSEPPLSSATIDDTIPVLQHNEQEEAKIDVVPSLEHEEPHIEPSDELKDEPKVDTEEIKETISKESELTIEHKSCDEALDEWNNTTAKVAEEEKHELLEPIEVGETLQKVESQQSEELIRNAAEEEKTSDSSVVEQQAEEKVDKDISDNLDQELDNMSSPLNPDAKEFVPHSSPISFEKRIDFSLDSIVPNVSNSPFANNSEFVAVDNDFEFDTPTSPEVPNLSIATGVPPHMISCMNGDDLVAQSPQKGTAPMLDFQVPSPKEFASEVKCRPSEVSTLDSSQDLNLKESMHEPEKELISPMENIDTSAVELSGIQSPVDTSLGKIEDMMNSVQMLPVDDDLEEENKSNTSAQPDVTLNGEVPLITELSNLKLGEPKAVAETPAVKSKVEKTAKTPEVKKTDVKSKPSSTGPKKAISSTSATISDSTKAKTSTTASKTKVGAALTARPRTAPAPSSKPASAEKKSSTNVISARAKPEAKPPTSAGLKKLPLTKPKPEDSKSAGTARQVTSKVASTTRNATTTARTASTTSTTTATAKRTTLTTTSAAAKSPAGPRSTLSPNPKTSTFASTHKPAISPRSTVTSTMRKTEALKSPTSATKPAAAKTSTASATSTLSKTTSRASGGTTTVTKTTTTVTKKLTSTTASKPATTPATKKPVGVKKTSGTTTTATATKLKGAASPIKAPTANGTPEIKMNGAAPAVATTNGNGVSEE